jgi:hypothetical protein
MFHVRARQTLRFLPPILWRNVKVLRPHQIAHAAALVNFGNPAPESIELLRKLLGFVEQNTGRRDQIEDAAAGPGQRRVKLPTGENIDPGGAHRGFHNLFIPSNSLPAEPRMDRSQQMLAHRRLRQRKQQGFIHRIRRALRSRIEFSNRFRFIAKEFNAQRSVRLRGVHVENAAADRILPRHFNHIG